MDLSKTSDLINHELITQLKAYSFDRNSLKTLWKCGNSIQYAAIEMFKVKRVLTCNIFESFFVINSNSRQLR